MLYFFKDKGTCGLTPHKLDVQSYLVTVIYGYCKLQKHLTCQGNTMWTRLWYTLSMKTNQILRNA